jgi:hypothetical protein
VGDGQVEHAEAAADGLAGELVRDPQRRLGGFEQIGEQGGRVGGAKLPRAGVGAHGRTPR